MEVESQSRPSHKQNCTMLRNSFTNQLCLSWDWLTLGKVLLVQLHSVLTSQETSTSGWAVRELSNKYCLLISSLESHPLQFAPTARNSSFTDLRAWQLLLAILIWSHIEMAGKDTESVLPNTILLSIQLGMPVSANSDSSNKTGSVLRIQIHKIRIRIKFQIKIKIRTCQMVLQLPFLDHKC